MGRCRDRQRTSVGARRAAKIRIKENADSMRMMTAALVQQDYEDRLTAAWRGNFSVLAFLFAFPDEPCMEALDLRGDYFDIRTGDTWDLFFPGYYKSSHRVMEVAVGAQPVGAAHTSDWYFSSHEFDSLRRQIEEATFGTWTFSGAADLVLLNVWIPDHGKPVVDWDSVQFGSLAASGDGSLKSVVERISRDLERGEEDASYGVSSVVNPPVPPGQDSTPKKVLIGAAGGILAAIGKSHLGL